MPIMNPNPVRQPAPQPQPQPAPQPAAAPQNAVIEALKVLQAFIAMSKEAKMPMSDELAAIFQQLVATIQASRGMQKAGPQNAATPNQTAPINEAMAGVPGPGYQPRVM